MTRWRYSLSTTLRGALAVTRYVEAPTREAAQSAADEAAGGYGLSACDCGDATWRHDRYPDPDVCNRAHVRAAASAVEPDDDSDIIDSGITPDEHARLVARIRDLRASEPPPGWEGRVEARLQRERLARVPEHLRPALRWILEGDGTGALGGLDAEALATYAAAQEDRARGYGRDEVHAADIVALAAWLAETR